MTRPPPLPRMQGAGPAMGERTPVPHIAPAPRLTRARIATPYWAYSTWSGGGWIGSNGDRRGGSDGAAPPSTTPAPPSKPAATPGAAGGGGFGSDGAPPSLPAPWAPAKPARASRASGTRTMGDRSTTGPSYAPLRSGAT